ncbi:betaine/proline/choline family ABC transporter ATP-binding protein [Virgibacillus dakarensis]|uniref:Quaternary amine transport ATP-binding protein n=1 Tax=Lentibacillus populi TaxID=1827502 RepID=A0A9W5X445_9BACI|nr:MULTISPECIES: ABC transporter ATP-binding protein [Bacillaceae]MBT2214996.1 ABC transporter ATP-binding protein [Virgibacillus dakarensis]MTW84867.1 betaine/proline/choline family ABC transporter ATP-binding protein [Virgibacillus dakarensis]GGB31182.1 glycine/betaine ABC transporter ATP-binding protein [Lentibacillus populi]
MIEFNRVNKVYPDGTEALKDFSLQVNNGELVTLIGPSGCGKTTTMKMINRLIEPTSGAIYINDKDINDYNIHELRWNIGYVLQEIALFPHMTIEENIAVVPEMKKWKRKKIRERGRELLDMVGLDPATYQKRMPSELSGGQQQRIGVIRALAADPDIILMDEPFSALDPISREQLQSDIRKLQKEIKKTIVFVTHDMDEAMAIGDKVCLMRHGQVVQMDTPQELILHPATQFVKDFIGERKSPWQTAVDVIADQSNDRVITKKVFAEKTYQTAGTYIIRDEHNMYYGAATNGIFHEVKTLDNHLPLYKATEIIQSSDQVLFPVVKEQKLVGVLSYKDIVAFLKSKTKMENGVIQ